MRQDVFTLVIFSSHCIGTSYVIPIFVDFILCLHLCLFSMEFKEATMVHSTPSDFPPMPFSRQPCEEGEVGSGPRASSELYGLLGIESYIFPARFRNCCTIHAVFHAIMQNAYLGILSHFSRALIWHLK